jgi:hypothetical protein
VNRLTTFFASGPQLATPRERLAPSSVAKPLLYLTGEEIRKSDRVLLHGDPGEIDLVLDGENNLEAWPAEKYGRGILVAEPKTFGYLFLTEADIGDYEDLEFVSRSPDFL